MSPEALQSQLAGNIQRISDFLEQLPEAYLQRSPDHRWTIAQELLHLTKSNEGTARLLSRLPEQLRKAENPSRSYEEIVREYQTKYAAANPPRGPQGVQPDEEASMDKFTLASQWNKTGQALLKSMETWPENKWGQYTLWKHPLLGVLTVQEMLYFTTFHNEHHAGIMEAKYTTLSESTT
ncbi:MAG: DinB family protein [Cyclobacteriaceae bacterium]